MSGPGGQCGFVPGLSGRGEEYWETGCGEEISTDEDIVSLWTYCPYCGAEIIWENR